MRVLVTGGNGFLGKHVVNALREAGHIVFAPPSYPFDLRRPERACEVVTSSLPDAIIHLASFSGGIGANRIAPATAIHDTLLMGLNVLQAAVLGNVNKVIMVGSVCAYPKNCPVPFHEEDLWNGYPEETNSAYGIAKRALEEAGRAYRKQYGLNVVHLLMTNLYGPGDNFDPETSHVIPALIRKVAARDFTLWGTGKATRDFLYVKDAAETIVTALERYDGERPINIGTGVETSIADAANTIAGLMGQGWIRWEVTPGSPNGQPRRVLDIHRALIEFEWWPTTLLFDGLRETIDWYKKEGKGCESLLPAAAVSLAATL